MKTLFVSRHPSSIRWIRWQPVHIDEFHENCPIEAIASGDIVIETLPMHLAAAVCAKGARYIALTMDIPVKWRGRTLTDEELAACDVRLVEFAVAEKGNFLKQ